MPKRFSPSHVVKALERKGFVFVSQKDSHAKYKKDGEETLIVIVPMHSSEIPVGTFKSILRQSKLSIKDFGHK